MMNYELVKSKNAPRQATARRSLMQRRSPKALTRLTALPRSSDAVPGIPPPGNKNAPRSWFPSPAHRAEKRRNLTRTPSRRRRRPERPRPRHDRREENRLERRREENSEWLPRRRDYVGIKALCRGIKSAARCRLELDWDHAKCSGVRVSRIIGEFPPKKRTPRTSCCS